MTHALQNLLNLLTLEKLNTGLFSGQSEDIGLRQVFGGQVIGQALYAARNTLSEDRYIHSCHSYFLRPGNSQQPVIYDVENLRDGKNFSVRRISAIQNGVPIFCMTASAQIPEHSFEHQSTMPIVPPPDNLPSESETMNKIADLLPEKFRFKLLTERPLDIRPVTFHNPLKGYKAAPTHQVWLRANGLLPSDQYIHQYILGYASDMRTLPVALQPHGKGFFEKDIQVATLDHAMWFHHPIDLNQWLLYSLESTSASGARGLVRGEFFSQNGLLVATTVQEGVIRQRKLIR